MTRRLFIGITLPDEAVDALVADQAALSPHLRTGRASDRENLHLTLVFLGEVDDDVERRVRDAVRAAATACRPLTLSLGDLGSFDHHNRLVLWRGIQPGAGLNFTGEVNSALQKSAQQATTWQNTILGFVSRNVFEAMSTASMIPIIIFALLFGVALNSYVSKTGNKLVLDVLDQVQHVVLLMIRFVMYIAPIGVFALLATLAGEVGFAVVTTGLKYLGATLLGVIIVFALFVLVACYGPA